MSAPATATALAYLHGFEAIVIVGVLGLLGGVAFAVVLAFILRKFLPRRQQATTPEGKRRERNI